MNIEPTSPIIIPKRTKPGSCKIVERKTEGRIAMTKKYARARSILWILTLTAAAWAQVYSGSLTGVVKDPSGGIVPGAAVKLTDTNKGYSYNAKTDDSGRYLLRSLLPVDVHDRGLRRRVQAF